VPEEQVVANLVPTNAAKPASNCDMSGPTDMQFSSKHFATASLSAEDMNGSLTGIFFTLLIGQRQKGAAIEKCFSHKLAFRS